MLSGGFCGINIVNRNIDKFIAGSIVGSARLARFGNALYLGGIATLVLLGCQAKPGKPEPVCYLSAVQSAVDAI